MSVVICHGYVKRYTPSSYLTRLSSGLLLLQLLNEIHHTPRSLLQIEEGQPITSEQTTLL